MSIAPPANHVDELPLETAFPSIASLRLGRGLGWLYECVPVRIGTFKLSHLIFPLPTAPLAALLYFGLKVWGRRYRLTTHRLMAIRGLTQTQLAEIPLDEIGRLEIVATRGQRFFHAGNIVVRDHQGLDRLHLDGIAYPEMLRQTILDARNALTATEAAQRIIAARRAGRARSRSREKGE